MDVVSFQRKWIGASNLKERTASQSHFNDLCDLLGVPKPTDIDHTGESYTFERGATITAGGNGWADVWMKGHFAWEYKGQGKNLDDAYVQLLRYKDDLGNPPLMVVSDLNIIRVNTNFTNTVKKVYEYDLNSLSDPGALTTLRKLWTDPLDLRPRQTPDQLTAEAAGVFAGITRGLYDRGQHPESTAHFLVQVVFSLFAEDIGLLPDNIFSEIAKADAKEPEAFQQDVAKLFTAMQKGGRIFLKTIPWVNGGLFAEVDVPLLTIDEIVAIRTATRLDWSQIEPAIFGTLFERSLDPTKRSQLGAHYTSKEDIERVVEPVVMQPLRREWAEIREAIESGELSTKKPRNKPMSPAEARIVEYLDELRVVTVLDPACGSGNFLYVALSALLTLEKEVMTWRAINLNQPLGLSGITPKQLKGIEINIHA